VIGNITINRLTAIPPTRPLEIAMMKFSRNMVTILALGALIAGLSACQKQEGPAERAGKAMDNAVEKAGEKIEKAGEKIQDAAKDAGK
jgi:hypothetical protein